jgi:tetraacyldisaccharide 4'-kinase
VLGPLEALYSALVRTRIHAYKRGWLQIYRPGIPVISVGNLTAGGSGKTPVADYLLATLHPNRAALLSRGYGRMSDSEPLRLRWDEEVSGTPELLGDEPCLLAQRHPDTPVFVGANRSRSARLAESLDCPDCLVLDDGYQHLALHRDFNLLLVDAERGLGNRRLLPLGPLREPVSHWKRADAVLITKANLGDPEVLLHQLQGGLGVTKPVFRFDYLAERLERLDGQVTRSLDSARGMRVMPVCGIAQPEGFFRILELSGLRLDESLQFLDHYAYTAVDVCHLQERLKTSNADGWVTTEKDAVKLRAFPELAESGWVLTMAVKPEPAWADFWSKRLHALGLKAPDSRSSAPQPFKQEN